MRRDTILFLCIVILCIVAVVTLFEVVGTYRLIDKETESLVTISSGTTFFTEPIRGDGSVDFVAAINNHFGAGVNPEENACAYLHRAFGPMRSIPPSFYDDLQIETPPTQGTYLRDLPYPYEELTAERFERIMADASRAVYQPWAREECPELGEWLDANRQALELVHVAANCQKFYSPLTDGWSDDEKTTGPVPLLAVFLPAASKLRLAGRMLCCRAMLRAEAGDAEIAWRDLMACRRLGRLSSRGPTLIETLAGYSIEEMSHCAMLALLESTHPSSATVKQYQDDILKLPPIQKISDTVDVFERCSYIDTMLTIAADRTDAIELLGVEPEVGEAARMFRRFRLAALDWNEALKTGNEHYDRLISCMSLPTHAQRRAAIEKLTAELKDYGTLLKFNPKGVREKETARALGSVIAAVMVPAIAKAREAEDTQRQNATNMDVALALCAYRNQEHQYPDELGELVPEYLARMPMDQFAGVAPIYRRTNGGYALYSVGPNGRDESARNSRDGDDIGFTMEGVIDSKL